MTARARKYWLMKSEPDVYSIQDLERGGREGWEGVRNYQARNLMRDEMRVGDLVLFYHSNAKPPGVAGVSRICREAYTDDSQFDPESPYYDARADPKNPRWVRVDVEYVETFEDLVSLPTLKGDPDLADMLVTQRGSRLSVQPVAKHHFRHVLGLAKAKTRA